MIESIVISHEKTWRRSGTICLEDIDSSLNRRATDRSGAYTNVLLIFDQQGNPRMAGGEQPTSIDEVIKHGSVLYAEFKTPRLINLPIQACSTGMKAWLSKVGFLSLEKAYCTKLSLVSSQQEEETHVFVTLADRHYKKIFKEIKPNS